MSIDQITNKFDNISSAYGLDLIDLKILGLLSAEWKAGRQVHVTQITLCGKLASPATLQSRLSKSLTAVGLIEVKPDPEDGRARLVIKGPKYREFEDYLNELYMQG